MEKKYLDVEHNGNLYKISSIYRKSCDEMLLFIHGLGCSKDSFRDVYGFEGLKEYSILTIDLLGFGDSDKKDFSYKMEDHALILAKILEQFSFKKLHVIAHSMGGAVGLLLQEFIQCPFASFANLEGNLIPDDCGTISRKSATLSYKTFLNNLMPVLLKTKFDDRFFIHDSDPEGFYKSAVSLVNWSDSGKLINLFRNLSCLKAFFYGSHNKGMEILKHLSDIRSVEIENSGHFMMNDNSIDFYSKLKRFIEGLG